MPNRKGGSGPFTQSIFKMKSDATKELGLQFFEAILNEYTPTGAPTVHLQRLLLQFGGAPMRGPIRERVQAYRAKTDLQPTAPVANPDESAPAYADGFAPRFAVFGGEAKTTPPRAVAGPSPQTAQPAPITAAPQNGVPAVAVSGESGESNALEIQSLTPAEVARILELGAVRAVAKEFDRARLLAFLAEREIEIPDNATPTQVAGFVLEELKK